MSKYNLKKGDILLFDYEGGGSMGIFSWLIKKATQSNITHVAMVLKDPVFISPVLKGYYVWESGWEGTPDPQDGKVKFGVQITPLDEILQSYQKTIGKIYVRRVHCKTDLFTPEKLEEIQSKAVYGTSLLGKYTTYKLTNNENQNLAFLCMILPLDNSVIFVKLSSTVNALERLEKEFDTFCTSFRKR